MFSLDCGDFYYDPLLVTHLKKTNITYDADGKTKYFDILIHFISGNHIRWECTEDIDMQELAERIEKAKKEHNGK